MNQQSGSRYLGEEKISKLMLKFSIPCILSQLVSSLYNIVDQIFIGNSELSTLGNAATGVVFPIFIIAQAFAWCFGDGCAAYLNICQGKNDYENAHKAIGASITTAFLAGLAVWVIDYFLLITFFPVGVLLPVMFLVSLTTFMGVYAAYPKIKEIMIDPYYVSDSVGARKRDEAADEEPTDEPIFTDRG